MPRAWISFLAWGSYAVELAHCVGGGGSAKYININFAIVGFFNYFLSALFVCGTHLLMFLFKMSFYSGLKMFTHNISYIQPCPQWDPEFQSLIFEHHKFDPISSVLPWFVLEITVFHQLDPLGRVGLVVAMSRLSVCVFVVDVPFSCTRSSLDLV